MTRRRMLQQLLSLLWCAGCLVHPAATTPVPPPTTTNTGPTGDFADKLQQAMGKVASEFKARTTLAGRHPSPLVDYLLVSQHELSVIVHLLQTNVHWEDLVLLVSVGWLTVPLCRILHFIVPSSSNSSNNGNTDNGNDGLGSLASRSRYPVIVGGGDTSSSSYFRHSVIFQIADHLQQVTRIALAVYMVDILKLLGLGLGFGPVLEPLPHAFLQIAYTTWAANRGTALTRWLLRHYVNRHPETFGRMKIVQRLADAILYGLGVMVVLNILQVQTGVAVQSILAFGSVGTLAVGLASQGIAKEVLNGLMLASSDRVYEGDDVRFGNGLSGSIVKLGWMETVLRGSDEIMVSVPNTHLVSERVANLSRVRMSQVKQVLRVKHDDADKIPAVMDRIKHEIKMVCPDLVTDGTRPFRVYWTNINSDHCEVTVDTRHRIKPTGDVFLRNQQNVLEAINRALKRHNCKLAEVA